MKLVVSGALGHIGSGLIREIPKVFPQAEVLMLDNLATQRYGSLFDLPPEGHYSFIEGDVLTAPLEKLFQGADAVIHLAAITNAAASFKIRKEIEKVNYGGTKQVAKACVHAGCPLIFPSSTSVYGTQKEVVDENCPLLDLKPQSPYAETKLKEESFLHTLGESKGLRYVICRFGTICGVSPGMRFHTAVNKFCWQAVMGEPLTVWQTALHQKRPYLSLRDGVHAIAHAIRSGLFDGKTYNVLTANMTVDSILKIIGKYVPDSKIKYVDHEIMNLLSYEVANARFQGTGFRYQGDLERDIRETIQLLRGARH
ncbi:MAG: NAD-dependent epimerase/dehydratase [Candidatus Omnitrophica bacterium]|nr:NAD-dependent epimerase/dehydratase [Candidatus Omnitrophota bacterium]